MKLSGLEQPSRAKHGLSAGEARATQVNTLDAQTFADAYVYLLGRLLVIRQEQIDVAEDGIDYNVIKTNPYGSQLRGNLGERAA